MMRRFTTIASQRCIGPSLRIHYSARFCASALPNTDEVKRAFATLEISHQGSSLDSVKKKFFELAKKHHPDANKGQSGTANKMVDINAAYKTLQQFFKAGGSPQSLDPPRGSPSGFNPRDDPSQAFTGGWTPPQSQKWNAPRRPNYADAEDMDPGFWQGFDPRVAFAGGYTARPDLNRPHVRGGPSSWASPDGTIEFEDEHGNVFSMPVADFHDHFEESGVFEDAAYGHFDDLPPNFRAQFMDFRRAAASSAHQAGWPEGYAFVNEELNEDEWMHQQEQRRAERRKKKHERKQKEKEQQDQQQQTQQQDASSDTTKSKPFSHDDLTCLKNLYSHGKDFKFIARALGRTHAEVIKEFNELVSNGGIDGGNAAGAKKHDAGSSASSSDSTHQRYAPPQRNKRKNNNNNNRQQEGPDRRRRAYYDACDREDQMQAQYLQQMYPHNHVSMRNGQLFVDGEPVQVQQRTMTNAQAESGDWDPFDMDEEEEFAEDDDQYLQHVHVKGFNGRPIHVKSKRPKGQPMPHERPAHHDRRGGGRGKHYQQQGAAGGRHHKKGHGNKGGGNHKKNRFRGQDSEMF